MSIGHDSDENHRRRVVVDARSLRKLQLSVLETEILDGLINGRKNAVELVEHIYGMKWDDPGHNAVYLKVCRGLRALERRGLVSTRLFGRDKPYRITPHGLGVLANIFPDADVPKVVSFPELAVILATTVSGLITLLDARGIVDISNWVPSLFIFGLFCSLFGYSVSVLTRVLRRVM